MIELASIGKSFGGRAILADLTLNVKKNELLALIGPSGCGKTTTLNIISGLLKPDQGTVTIDGEVVCCERDGKTVNVHPSKRGIGYVFQDYMLFPHMTVRENVAFGLKAIHLPRGEVETRTTSLLDFVGLRSYSSYYPHQLSGGQKQRVALARSVATNPKILLLDEPLSALDEQLREKLRVEFRNMLRSFQMTTVYVTHDLDEACLMSDKIAVMGNGRIEQVGDRDEIFSSASKSVAEFFGLNAYLGKIVSRSEALTRVEINRTEISAPPTIIGENQRVLVTIRPEDVKLITQPSIGLQKPSPDAPNSLPGMVTQVSEMRSSAKVTIDVGFPIRSELELAFFRKLNLTEGEKVHAQFQALIVGVA